MAHYAKVLEGRVLEVMVASPEFLETFVDTSPGDWIKTSYNTHGNQHINDKTPLRANFAQVGGYYDLDRDVFYSICEEKGWILNEETFIWEPPIPIPEEEGKAFYWNNEEENWAEAPTI